jgi:peptidase E
VYGRRQRLHLVGGGPGETLALQRHFEAALVALDAPRPVVAYVGVASNDNPGFQKMLTGKLALTGARFRPVHIASPRASIPEARALLDESDLVFVSGGDVDHGMNVLAERGILPHFRELASNGKPMFGISAGSVMLGREWVRFPDDDDSKAEIFQCIGAVPFSVDAHSEDDDWSELRTLLGLMKRRGDQDPVGYGLTTKGGIAVEVEDDRVLSMVALGTDIPRLVVRAGAVVHAEPLARSALSAPASAPSEGHPAWARPSVRKG